MKALLTTIILLGSISAWGHSSHFNPNEEQIMSVWDGTFFYNTISVNKFKSQDNILAIYVRGASIGIGSQMDPNIGESWASDDILQIVVKKDECEVFDEATKTLTCNIAHRKYTNITWSLNPVITKTYNGTVENIKIDITKESAEVSFEITPNDYIEAAVSRLEFKVSSLIPTF